MPSTRPVSRRIVLALGTALVLAIGIVLAVTMTLPPATPAQAEAAPSHAMAADVAHDKALRDEIVLVDIRTPPEWAETGLPEGAIGLDMSDKTFVKSLVTLREAHPDKPIALICRTGSRSGRVVNILSKQGFPGLVDVSEGVVGGRNGTGWLRRGLPTYPGTPAEIRKRKKAVLP